MDAFGEELRKCLEMARLAVVFPVLKGGINIERMELQFTCRHSYLAGRGTTHESDGCQDLRSKSSCT